MRDADGQRLQLKSKLLAGAAGMTAMVMSTAAFAADAAPSADATATPAPAAPAATVAPAATPAQAMAPIDPPKWLPYVDIGGGVGSGFAIGRANAFVPFWQDLDSLAFIRFGAATDTRGNSANDFNIGAGYRTKINDEWIVGGFAGFDSTQTNYNHTFNQFSFGLEAMSADWDIRANAYLAKNTNRTISNKFELYIHDTTIAILQGQEAALSGFDGEVGYRIFSTNSTDVRVFAGAYTFHHSDVSTAGVGTNFTFPYHDLTGPKLRAEVNVFDLDMLGSQSRFSVEGQVSHDSVNHTSEYIGATLRIALNDPSGSGAQALDDLDRRMADPVRRSDNVLTQWNFNKPEPVIIYNSTVTSKPTNTLFYAEQRGSAATGSYADQTTIQDATSRGGAGKNAFIVLTDAGGSAIDATGTTVQSGETLTGAGTFKVRGVNSSIPVFTHDFAPGSGPVSLTTTSGNVLNIVGDANIANLSITGPFADGIYGANVGDVNISHVTIDGGGAGANGIVFKQTDTSGTSNIVIKNSSITGVTNDGVDLTVSATAGNTSTTNLVGSNLVISAGHDGVSIASNSTGMSNATVYAGIHDSTLTAGNAGAEMSGTTSGGGTLTQTLLIDPTTIHVSSGYGIYVHGAATSGTLTQNVSISDVNITGTPDYGVSIYGAASGAGHLVQTVEVQNLDIVPAGVGVQVRAHGAHGGQLNQSVDLTNVVANGATHDGISIGATAYSGATVIQTVDIDHLQSSNNGGSGVDAYVYAYSATGDAPSVAAQYLTVTSATLSGNGFAGVVAYAGASTNAVVREDVTVEHATLSDNIEGISVTANALDGASSQQNIYFAYDTVQHNAADGIVIDVNADGGFGFAAQYGTIYNVDASYNGQDGFHISATAKAADAEQLLYLVDITGDHEGNDGLEITSHAQGYFAGSYTNYPAHLQQSIYAEYGSFSHNAKDGVEINNYAVDGASIDQYVIVYGMHTDYNGENGVLALSYDVGSSGGAAYSANTTPTHLYTTLLVEGGTANHNGYSGIYQYTSSVGSTEQRDHVTVSGEHADYNTVYGFGNFAYSTGYYSVNLQYVTLAGSTFDHNGASGAFFKAQDYYGPGPYGFAGHIVTISDSDFSHNGESGLYAIADASGENGRAEQYFTIEYSNFSHNTDNGLSVYNYAHDGQYNAGYDCFTVQGTAGGCAIVRSSVTAIGSHFDDNGDTGIVISSYAKNYGTIYAQSGHGTAPSLYLAGSTLDGNANYGLVLANGVKYGSGEIQTVYITGTDISHNGKDGIFGINAVKYGEQYQTITIAGGSTIEHNAGDGIDIITYAKYTPFEVTTLAVNDSSVSDNAGSGVYIETTAKYSFNGAIGGVFEQAFYANGSTFDDNGYHGVYTETRAANFVYAYQVVGTQDSDFSGNGTAATNKYGLGDYFFSFHNVYGGQYVSSQNDTFTHNSGGGLRAALFTVANKYAPTYQNISVTGDHFDNNTGNGLYVGTRDKYGSTVYQNFTGVDSTFDNNGSSGIYVQSYVKNAGLIRQFSLYTYDTGNTATGNTGHGMKISDEVVDGGYLNSQASVVGVNLSNNGGFGFEDNISYADNSSTALHYNTLTGDTINSNDDGIGLYSIGPGAAQYTTITNTKVQNNAFVGVYGDANTGAYQYVSVYTGGNTVTGNSPNYLFNVSGGATHVIN